MKKNFLWVSLFLTIFLNISDDSYGMYPACVAECDRNYTGPEGAVANARCRADCANTRSERWSTAKGYLKYLAYGSPIYWIGKIFGLGKEEEPKSLEEAAPADIPKLPDLHLSMGAGLGNLPQKQDHPKDNHGKIVGGPSTRLQTSETSLTKEKKQKQKGHDHEKNDHEKNNAIHKEEKDSTSKKSDHHPVDDHKKYVHGQSEAHPSMTEEHPEKHVEANHHNPHDTVAPPPAVYAHKAHHEVAPHHLSASESQHHEDQRTAHNSSDDFGMHPHTSERNHKAVASHHDSFGVHPHTSERTHKAVASHHETSLGSHKTSRESIHKGNKGTALHHEQQEKKALHHQTSHPKNAVSHKTHKKMTTGKGHK